MSNLTKNENTEEPEYKTENNRSESKDDREYIPVVDKNDKVNSKGVVKPYKYISIDQLPEEQRVNLKDLTLDEWNQTQLPINRIYNPCTFDKEVTPITFTAPKVGTFIDKDGKQDTYDYSEIKSKKYDKEIVGITLQGPSVVASRGYAVFKKDSNPSIGFLMDMNNPQHRHFINVTYEGMIKQCIDHFLMNPDDYKIKQKKIITKEDIEERTQSYLDLYEAMHQNITHFWSYPKKGKKPDYTSNILQCFVNPINIISKSEEKKDFIASIIVVTDEIHNLSLDQLFKISEGYYVDDNGVERKGKPKSFEFSFSIQFSRISSSGPSVKNVNTSCILTDIFNAKVFKREDEIRAEEMKSMSSANNFTKLLGVKGFKDEISEKRNVKGSLVQLKDGDGEDVEVDFSSRKKKQEKDIVVKKHKEESSKKHKKSSSRRKDKDLESILEDSTVITEAKDNSTFIDDVSEVTFKNKKDKKEKSSKKKPVEQESVYSSSSGEDSDSSN